MGACRKAQYPAGNALDNTRYSGVKEKISIPQYLQLFPESVRKVDDIFPRHCLPAAIFSKKITKVKPPHKAFGGRHEISAPSSAYSDQGPQPSLTTDEWMEFRKRREVDHPPNTAPVVTRRGGTFPPLTPFGKSKTRQPE